MVANYRQAYKGKIDDLALLGELALEVPVENKQNSPKKTLDLVTLTVLKTAGNEKAKSFYAAICDSLEAFAS